MKFFIPGNVPSSKNNRVWTGKAFIKSKRTMDYIKNTEENWYILRKAFVAKFKNVVEEKGYPVKIGFSFVRDSKRKYDWHNMIQICLDLMVKYGWIEDDNVEIVVPYPFKVKSNYSNIDKDKPGVWIEIK